MDIALFYDKANLSFDWQIANGDLVVDDGLYTALELSICSDRLHDLAVHNSVRIGAMCPYAKNYLILAGPHDMAGGETLSQLESDARSVWSQIKAACPGAHVYMALSPPQASSTDSFATYTNQSYDTGFYDPADVSPCLHCTANGNPVGSYPCTSGQTGNTCSFLAATLDAYYESEVGVLNDGVYKPGWAGTASNWPYLFAAGADCPQDANIPSSMSAAQPAGQCTGPTEPGAHPNANGTVLGAAALYKCVTAQSCTGGTWAIN